MGKLTVAKARSAVAGRHADGRGLYLFVKPSGARSWVLRVQYQGRREDIGLGSDADLSLEEAREKAAYLRKIARQGKDARAERDKEKAIVPTFAKAVELAHAELSKGWADKTGEAFKASLETHAVPTIGRLRVDHISTNDLIAVLSPIWTEKPQQARKIRHRLLQVLAFAKARGWRSAPVPIAQELRQGLARQPESKNFAAVPFVQVPDFVAGELAKEQSAARLALILTILTGARSGEVRKARWEQIDFAARTWTRPGEIMKSGKTHVVTLSGAAIWVLERAAEAFGQSELIFPGAKSGTLSDMTLAKVLRSAGRSETVHGFRSSFRDWAAEKMPTIPAMVAEMALAHSVGNATEQAYLRSDLRDMRRSLTDAWGQYVASSISKGAGHE